MRIARQFIATHKFYFTYALSIVAVATTGLLFQQIYFLDTQWPNYYRLTCSNFISYILCFISYASCIRIRNNIPPNLSQPRLRSQLHHNHPAYTSYDVCHRDNNRYKPPRTSHCSRDGCVARFDHHCPYINNCVALPNLKAFLLFNGYGGIFALQFLLVSIYKYFLLTVGVSSLFSEAQVVIWMLLTIISLILSLAMLGLLISNLLLITKNITHIDVLKGNFRFKDPQGKFYNPYNIGCFSNYRSLFQGQLWTFWWPSKIISRYDGLRFPMVPAVTEEDCKSLPINTQQLIVDPIEKQIPRTIEQLYQKQRQNYRNVVLFYCGQQYRIGQQSTLQRRDHRKSKILVSANYQQIVQQLETTQQRQKIFKKDNE